MLCKHEVAGSIPVGSTIGGGQKTTLGLRDDGFRRRFRAAGGFYIVKKGRFVRFGFELASDARVKCLTLASGRSPFGGSFDAHEFC